MEPGLAFLVRPGVLRTLAAVAGCLCAGAAAGQSLRCNSQLVSVGESKFSVASKCGDPAWREMVCVARELFVWQLPAVPGQVLQPLVGPGCVPMEEWTYHRGQGNFLAIVRFRNTSVESIRDGERMP